MGLTPKKIEVLHNGYHRYERRYFENDGLEFTRDVLVSKDAVASFIYHPDRDQYGFVKQFRAGSGEYMLECPAGVIDEGETPVDAISREVREELGCDVNEITYEGYTQQGPASVSGIIHLFICTVTGDFEQSLDSDEQVEIVWLSKDEYEKMIFTDMKTLILTMKYNKNEH